VTQTGEAIGTALGEDSELAPTPATVGAGRAHALLVEAGLDAFTPQALEAHQRALETHIDRRIIDPRRTWNPSRFGRPRYYR
jgi:hypothetical protein